MPLQIYVLNAANINVNRRRRKERYTARMEASIMQLNDVAFKNTLRVDRGTFNLIFTELQPHLSVGSTTFSITPETKVSAIDLSQIYYYLKIYDTWRFSLFRSSLRYDF